jgi:ubiquinone/menaquinone biosynthesis C-methylase UbiE
MECRSWLDGRKRILDVGCGTSRLVGRLSTCLPIVGIDASLAMLAAGEGRPSVAAADASFLPFSSRSFDGILSINVLEHVSDAGHHVRDLARMLAPGGRLVLTTPAKEMEVVLDFAEKVNLKIPEGPHRLLSSADLLAIVSSTGLAVECFRRILPFPFGGEAAARAGRHVEGLFRRIGFQHWLVARSR